VVPLVELNKVFQIYTCSSCRNAFTSPPPAPINYQQSQFAAQAKYTDLDQLPNEWRSSSKLQLELVNKHLSNKGKILEIGCGNGIFLKRLQSLGFDVAGVEPSKQSVTEAVENGLKIIPGYYPSKKVTGKYDFIIATHVLEHIKDYNLLFKSIHNQLNPGGYLMLTQTNYTGLLPLLAPKWWYGWLPSQHFYHFTPEGIINLTKNSSFKVVDIAYSSLVHPTWKNFFIRKHSQLGDQFHIVLEKINR
jgi:SAM-dependent methyltransferase